MSKSHQSELSHNSLIRDSFYVNRVITGKKSRIVHSLIPKIGRQLNETPAQQCAPCTQALRARRREGASTQRGTKTIAPGSENLLNIVSACTYKQLYRRYVLVLAFFGANVFLQSRRWKTPINTHGPRHSLHIESSICATRVRFIVGVGVFYERFQIYSFLLINETLLCWDRG